MIYIYGNMNLEDINWRRKDWIYYLLIKAYLKAERSQKVLLWQVVFGLIEYVRISLELSFQ
jgi:hypothetical protein